MDLSTQYLGLKLAHPLMSGASPMVDDLDVVRRLEDNGVAAIVMLSLFEEQLTGEEVSAERNVRSHSESSAEATSFFPDPDVYRLGPDEYLEQIAKIKKAIRVPVIASLNGTTKGGWLHYAKLMQEAGADALELNVYQVATEFSVTSEEIERKTIELIRAVKNEASIPVAVKLSPFYTCLAHFAKQLDHAGADGLVLFNRFYQPDIDPEQLEVVHDLKLSRSSELLLRLRWLAILSGRIRASLAVTGGVHEPIDALKAVMAGAHAVQVVSALLQKGPSHLRTLTSGLEKWLVEHEYESLKQAQGSMNLLSCPNPKAFERGNYVKILQTFEDYQTA